MGNFIRFTRMAYRLAGFRFFYLILLMCTAVFLEGLSVSLFMPILMGVEAENDINQILASAFKFAGIAFSFRNVLLWMVLFFFLKNGFLVLQGSCIAKIISNILVHLRTSTVEKMYEASYEYLSRKPAGYLTNAATREFEQVSFAFKMYANALVRMIYVAAYLAIPLVLNAKLTALIGILAVPAYFVIKKINRLTSDYSIKQSAHSSALQSLLIQALHNLKYLKATHTYPSVLKKIERESRDLGQIQYRTGILGSITQYAFEPFVILVLAGLLFYHVELQNREVLEIAFLIYLLRRAAANLLSIQQAFRKFLTTIGSLRVYALLERELAQNSEDLSPKGEEPDFSQPFVFEDVSFAFETSPPILHHLNFEIAPNTMVAVVGASGSGKSTLVNLLAGILLPTAGQIRLGNTPLSKIATASFRRAIGYITQETVIFNDSLKNNLSLWDPNLNQQDIEQATTQAGLQEVIANLDNGLDTQLGEGGITLSGGQRQRVMIARELCKQSQLLIFDEATSALDSQSEQAIQHSIDALRGQKTIVVIAHRLATIQNSDHILVIENGRIAESGTYDALMAQNAVFKRMVDRQTLTPAARSESTAD